MEEAAVMTLAINVKSYLGEYEMMIGYTQSRNTVNTVAYAHLRAELLQPLRRQKLVGRWKHPAFIDIIIECLNRSAVRRNNGKGPMKKILFTLMLALFAAPGALFAGDLLGEVKELSVVKNLLPPQVEVIEARDLGSLFELVVKEPSRGK